MINGIACPHCGQYIAGEIIEDKQNKIKPEKNNQENRDTQKNIHKNHQ